MHIDKKNIMTIIMLIACFVISVTYTICLAPTAIINKGIIVLDAGHGGIDGGVSYGDMIEANINLELCLKLKEILETKRYKVVLTRTSTNALAEGKKADMQKRKEVILKAKPDLMLSLHINKYSNPNRRGVQVFYDDTKNNKLLGERFQTLINSRVNAKYAGRSNLQSLGGDYFMCKCSPYPSLIIECGFISNAQDRELLQNNTYKKHLLTVIADGVDSACESDKNV